MTGVLSRLHYWKKQVFKDENTLCLAIGLWSNYFLDWCDFYHFAPGGKTSFDKSADIWSKENNYCVFIILLRKQLFLTHAFTFGSCNPLLLELNIVFIILFTFGAYHIKAMLMILAKQGHQLFKWLSSNLNTVKTENSWFFKKVR